MVAGLLALGACGSGGPIGPTPTIPGLPVSGVSAIAPPISLTISVERHRGADDFDGFARSANPLEFRSQRVEAGSRATERIPEARANDEAGQIAVFSTEDYERVVGRVRGTYLARLERCFGSGPGRGGKLQLAFTVAESGEVREARVTGLDAGINECVKKRVMRWSFASDRGSSGDASIVLSVVVM